MYNRVKKALEEIGASKALAEMRSSEYRYLAMRSRVDKQRLQKDHHESRMLREADAHTLMWYYTHMARGMTTPNQQPHAGRPWPELENRIVEIVGEHPNVGRRMLRQYLQMVTQPEARLAAMMETANSAGLGEDLLKATPSEYRAPS